jgi:hypothetical protein
MTSSIGRPLTSLSLAALALFSMSDLRAQSDLEQADEDQLDRTPRRCVTIARIRSTDILDDRTILFYLRGNKEVYRTYLPRECPGLERADRFSYRTHNGQLCDVDTITVLEEIGLSLSPTFTCRLGEFHPISREEAEELKLENEGEPLRRNAIRSEPVELPPSGAGSAAPEAADQPAEAVPPEAAVPDKRSRRERRGSGITSR